LNQLNPLNPINPINTPELNNNTGSESNQNIPEPEVGGAHLMQQMAQQNTLTDEKRSQISALTEMG